MKAWTTAEISGQCAWDTKHQWKAGTRIGVVQPRDGAWRKTYCGPCFKERHGMADDTGEVLDVTDAPNFPAPLKAMVDNVRAFDPRMAAAGKDE